MQAPPFHEYLGLRLVRRDAGFAEIELELEPHHLNRRGVAHGGVIATLLDSALGAAVIASIPESWWCATVSLSTQFVSGPGGGKLVGKGRLLRRGRKVAHAAGEVHDERGRLIATAQGSWHLWPHKPGTRPAGGSLPEPYVTIADAGESLRVGKIVAVGRNYAAHAAEMGAGAGEAPIFFLKPPSALVPGGGTVAIPLSRGAVHHEVELVAVIGSPGRHIPAASALDHVLGFAVGLDLTLRDVQRRAKDRGEPWSLAKGFDGSAPISAVAPRDRVAAWDALSLTLDLNGTRVQQGHTSQMLYPLPELIARLSQFMTLERGDLLFTGTPSGVGPLAQGDTLDARIDGVGTLQVVIEDEAQR